MRDPHTRRIRPWLLALAVTVGAAPAGDAAGDWLRLELGTGAYALRYLPAAAPDPAPVVVFLHGSGALPEDWQPLLQPVAEELGAVLVLPKSLSSLGFGVGADDRTVEQALAAVRAETAVDPRRTAIAGHSSGGAYAYVVALGSHQRFSAVFSLSAPYRTVLEVRDPLHTPPVRLYYGIEDPNFTGGSYSALIGQWDRLEVPWEAELRAGFGHSTWPATTLEDGFRFLLEQRYAGDRPCLPTDTRLCLQDGRFAVEGSWRDFQGHTGAARAVAPLDDESGLLWFFAEDNWEVLIKVLDGCAVNGRYWVLASASTNVEYELTVTDLESGRQRVLFNPLGVASPAFTDTATFAVCP